MKKIKVKKLNSKTVNNKLSTPKVKGSKIKENTIKKVKKTVKPVKKITNKTYTRISPGIYKTAAGSYVVRKTVSGERIAVTCTSWKLAFSTYKSLGLI